MSEISNILSLTDNYSIIGDKDQVLQILLKNDEGIITKQQYVAYSSKNLDEYLCYKMNENNILKQKEINDKGKLIYDDNLILLKNKQMNYEYVGLYNHGKIIKILPFLYKDLIINYERILGYSKNIDLIENKNISNRINPFLINPNRHLPKVGYFIIQNKYCLVISNNDALEKVYTNDVLNKRDYLFISAQTSKILSFIKNYIDPIIEKRLGIKEEIKIRKNSLVAYEESVSFSGITSRPKKKLDDEFFIVTGPGLIIFELLPVQNIFFDKKRQILGILIFFCLIIFSTLIHIYLDRLEFVNVRRQ